MIIHKFYKSSSQIHARLQLTVAHVLSLCALEYAYHKQWGFIALPGYMTVSLHTCTHVYVRWKDMMVPKNKTICISYSALSVVK